MPNGTVDIKLFKVQIIYINGKGWDNFLVYDPDKRNLMNPIYMN